MADHCLCMISVRNGNEEVKRHKYVSGISRRIAKGCCFENHLVLRMPIQESWDCTKVIEAHTHLCYQKLVHLLC